MSTTISLPTRNCIALGCDSLATSHRRLIDVYQLFNSFFNADGSHKLGSDGKYIELTVDSITKLFEEVPYNQTATVTKLFSFEPLFAGLLFAGLTHIGSKSFINIVDDFKATPQFENMKNGYTIEKLTESFKNFVFEIYAKAQCKDVVEIVISGYSFRSSLPEIRKIEILPCTPTITIENNPGEFNMVLGGQGDVIQRVVYGYDMVGFKGIKDTLFSTLEDYRRRLMTYLSSRGFREEIPEYEFFVENLNEIYEGFSAMKGTFSKTEQFTEQAAIDFVDFLIELTIKAQLFSNLLPTVGGEIHCAIISYTNGFKWISKEEYKFRGTSVPKDKSRQ